MLRDPANIEAFWASDFNSVSFFKPEFANPTNNFPELVTILEALCGTKKHKFGDKVLAFLQRDNSKLLTELLSFVHLSTDLLKTRDLAEWRVVPYLKAVAILCKIIKQNAGTVKVISDVYTKWLPRRPVLNHAPPSFGKQSLVQGASSNPYESLIRLICSSMNLQLMELKDFERSVTHCIEALTSVLKLGSDEIKACVIAELAKEVEHENSRPVPLILLNLRNFYQ